MITSKEIRRSFLRFFEERGHEVVPSSSLVPVDDPTLLFTNAGMVQFKDVFLGREKPEHSRVTDVQRCLRAGGKHNDLENVGYTARHHTFFEMLGNWSFGDYFKRDAIRFAWELLTETFSLSAEKLWITVYHTDDEAYGLWKDDIGVPAERIVRIGDEDGVPYASDNFWQMADTGPCGPCSEIFYDHGPEVEGGPPGSNTADGDRYIEIWNLVFMQFDRAADGTLSPLPAPCVDTGMGLERIAAVMQGVKSNYDIDLFRDLIVAAAEATQTDDLKSNSLKVIADHIRATAFLIVDGVLPANEGRGYVLRRIMRRAIRHGYKLGQHAPFFYKLVAALDAEMGSAYPELHRQKQAVEQTILQEEERFAQTLEQGLGLLEKAITALQSEVIPGETVFKLYDTYGFPVDLTADIARERGLALDMAGFERAMAAQRERARAASRFDAGYSHDIIVEDETVFSGYEHLRDEGRVIALFRDRQAVDQLATGERGIVVLDHTPFYAESGGQVGDTGVLFGDAVRFEVEDTQKRGAAHAHVGEVKRGHLALGEHLVAEVNVEHRLATVLNHSATHLLHAALREILGEHVTQKGSLVAPDRLRFDFSHPRAVTPAELDRIEALVNGEIRRNEAAHVRNMSYGEAMEAGAMALFGEKYGDTVRVMQFGDFSTELCGGTHVARTGDIGIFKIVSESGVAAGIRRIEALTGKGALEQVRELEYTLHQVEDLVKTGRDNVAARVKQIIERDRALEKEVQQLRSRLASGQGNDLSAQAVDVDGVKVLAARLDGADAKALREAVDQLKNKLKTAAVVLGAVDGNKVRLVAGVTKDKAGTIPAGELVNAVAGQVNGRGGGRADMAQAGGNDPARLNAALQSVSQWVHHRLSAA